MGTKSNALFGQIQLTYFENGCCATVTDVLRKLIKQEKTMPQRITN